MHSQITMSGDKGLDNYVTELRGSDIYHIIADC